MHLLRKAEQGIIEKYGNRAGCYRVVDDTLEFLDITLASVEESPLWLPLPPPIVISLDIDATLVLADMVGSLGKTVHG